MAYKLKITRDILPEKTIMQKWAESPLGWWEVTTEGDCEGRTTDNLGIHYGHVVEIALNLKCHGYSLCFRKAKEPIGFSGTPIHHSRRIVHKKVNISFGGLDMGKVERLVAEWLDCPEIKVSPCNYYGAYTITLIEGTKP